MSESQVELGWFVVKGQMASKSNRRQPRSKDGRVIRIEKSEAAKTFTDSAILQLKVQAKHYVGYLPVKVQCGVILEIYYRDMRSDVDGELFYDCLQKAGIVVNDRLIRTKLVYGSVDKENPRVACKLFYEKNRIDDPPRFLYMQ